MTKTTDILVIGAGVTGCSVARSLSRFSADILVVDRGADVAEGATKANSGIVHAGYDALPGTKKAAYNVRGAAMYPDLCQTLGVPYVQSGALVVAFSEGDRATLEKLLDRGVRNGVEQLRIIEHDELLALEPNLNPAAICALLVPTSGLVSPYELAYALADDAAINGVCFAFNEAVTDVARGEDGFFTVRTTQGEIRARAVVNCSGLSSAEIHNMLSPEKLTMVCRRGQYDLLDHPAAPLFTRTIFQCPSAMGKGVLVSPTVHGNILLGPTAEDIDDPLDTATTQAGLDDVLDKATLTWPGLSLRTNITNFSGIRAHLTTDDFVIGPIDGCPGAFDAAGVESPGLSSAPAIGEDLAAMVADYLRLPPKAEVKHCPPLPKPFREMTAAEREAAYAANPQYGNLICRCEVVTEAEIRAAIRRPVGARSIDGVKRRTRAGMGRCQGGFCMPRVAAILAEETGAPLTEIRKDAPGSEILADSIQSFLKGEHANG